MIALGVDLGGHLYAPLVTQQISRRTRAIIMTTATLAPAAIATAAWLNTSLMISSMID